MNYGVLLYSYVLLNYKTPALNNQNCIQNMLESNKINVYCKTQQTFYLQIQYIS